MSTRPPSHFIMSSLGSMMAPRSICLPRVFANEGHNSMQEPLKQQKHDILHSLLYLFGGQRATSCEVMYDIYINPTFLVHILAYVELVY